jgi:large subunit ribosomal protein L25
VSSHNLTVTSRETTGKEAAKRLRRAGSVPAVAYGHKEEPVKLAVDAKELRDLLAHGGSHSLLTLKQEGGSDVPVIIKSMQRHPVSHVVTSVDFLRVSLNEKVTMTVPIHLEGEPDAVRVEGGVLVQALHELQVEAFPQDIPDHITVDVTGLVFNGAPIHVREIALPRGVVAVTDGEEAVAVVNPPTVEPEPETSEDVDAADVPADHGSSDAGTSDGGDTDTNNS